ncbi:MAG: MFS transporter [Sterolibacterium sp.]|nr:MFS transporter [Sterolibacterium sp.]
MNNPNHPETGMGLQVGTKEFRRANLALAIGGFTCFALLYGTQPLLPQLTHDFGVSPGTASLSVSAGTAAMALLLIPLSLIADRYGRERLMKFGLLGAAVFAFVSALAPDFFLLLLCRAGLGVCIASVPAAAMAYLGEEIAIDARGRAMGIYIAANALGGMFGRILAALVTEWLNWRYGLAFLGLVGIGAALIFWRLLPPARHFTSRSLQPRLLLADVRRIYADPGLPWLFLTAFLIMGVFVGLYNYLGFRLNLPPYSLGPAAIGSMFLLYAVGSMSSAWAGHLVDRLGRRLIVLMMSICMAVGIVVTMNASLPLIILGVAIFTFGYFAAHAIASGWVGGRAGPRRGLVSALYLSSYYLGGSVIGSATGWPWSYAGWPGVAITLLVCIGTVIAIAIYLGRITEH